MGRFSLRTTVLTWLLAISLVPVLAVSIVGHIQSRKGCLADVTQKLLAMAENRRLQSLMVFNHMDRSATLGASNHYLLEALKNGTMASEPILTHLDQNWNMGEVLVWSPDMGDAMVHGSRGLSPADPRLFPQVREVFQSGNPQGRPFPAEGADLSYISRPIAAADGQPLGVLTLTLNKDEYLKRVDDPFTIPKGMSIKLVDEAGVVLVRMGNRERLSPSQRAAGDPVLVEGDPEPEKKLTGNGRQFQSDPDEDCLGVALHLDFQGHRYTLWATQSRDDALANLRPVDPTFLTTVGVVGLLASLAGLLIARRIVAPLEGLSRSIQRVADGHGFSALPDKGPREVLYLMDIFQGMISRLEEAQLMNESQFALKKNQYRLTEKLRGTQELEEMAHLVLDFLEETQDTMQAVFYVMEYGVGLKVLASQGIRNPDHLPANYRDSGILELALERGEVLVLEDQDEEWAEIGAGSTEARATEAGIRNWVVIPLQFDGQNMGAIEFGRAAAVSERDRELLDLVQDTVAGALNNTRSRERVNRLLRETWVQAETLSRQQKELQQTNRELARADQYKSEFLANMSHELRTPLNSLLIMAQILSENRGGRLNAEEVETAGTIKKAGEDLLLLINDILDHSRVDAGKMEFQISRECPVRMCRELEGLFRPVAENKGLSWTVKMGPNLPADISTDSLRLRQILRNILNNAFKFTAKGGVNLTVRMAGGVEAPAGNPDQIVFEITDTGIGMSADVPDKIFEPFQQGEGGIGRRFGGSGLGLSISRRLARILGGNILARSEEGQGSTFSLFLPVTAPAKLGSEGPHMVIWGEPENAAVGLPDSKRYAALVSEDDELAAALPIPEVADYRWDLDLQGKKILLCDDDMRTVFHLTDLLEQAGAEVQLARTWREGCAWCQEGEILDAVILNPYLSDAPAAETIQNRWERNCRGQEVSLLLLIEAGKSWEHGSPTAILERPVQEEALQVALEKAITTREETLKNKEKMEVLG